MTLRVAESSIAGTGAQDKEDYFRALKRKAELARRVDKWMDKTMEETVDRGQFQKAVSTPLSVYRCELCSCVPNLWREQPSGERSCSVGRQLLAEDCKADPSSPTCTRGNTPKSSTSGT